MNGNRYRLIVVRYIDVRRTLYYCIQHLSFRYISIKHAPKVLSHHTPNIVHPPNIVHSSNIVHPPNIAPPINNLHQPPPPPHHHSCRTSALVAILSSAILFQAFPIYFTAHFTPWFIYSTMLTTPTHMGTVIGLDPPYYTQPHCVWGGLHFVPHNNGT